MHAVINTGFDLGAFLVVIPSHDLETVELVAGRKILASLRHRFQPGLTAALLVQAMQTPGRNGIVEAFVGAADDQLAGGNATRIETIENG